jgi:hypothetical protein
MFPFFSKNRGENIWIWVLPRRFEQHVGETVMWSRGRFSRFVRVCLQSFQKVLLWFKTECNMCIKNANLDAELESVEKAANLRRKKLSTKKWRIEFLTFITLCKTFRPITFLGRFFMHFFQVLRFMIPKSNFKNIYFLLI